MSRSYSWLINNQDILFEEATRREEARPTNTRRGPCFQVNTDPVENLLEFLSKKPKGVPDVQMKSEEDSKSKLRKLVGYRSTTEDQRWLMVAFRYGSFERFDRVVNSYGVIAKQMGKSV